VITTKYLNANSKVSLRYPQNPINIVSNPLFLMKAQQKSKKEVTPISKHPKLSNPYHLMHK
jgi:hypothetical protein